MFNEHTLPGAFMRPRLLLYGHDAELLRIRQMVLKTGFNEALVTTDITELEEFLKSRSMDLLVLCHTLSEEQRKVALALICSLSPGTKALVLVVAAQRSLHGHYATLNTIEGPRQLLATVERLIHSPAQSCL